MSAVTVTGASDNGNNASSDTTTTQRKGNIGGFKQTKTLTKNLSALNTRGETFTAPDFAIKDILGAIPKECYERRLTSGFYYVFRDIAVCAAFMYIANNFIPLISNTFLRGVAWVSYAIILSLPYTGIWVMAHECGHQAFSDYGWVNDTVGWVLHSYLLVPYFSWKYSHGKHHKANANLQRDMVFVPKTKEEFKKKHNVMSLSELTSDSPISTLYGLLLQQFGGWWTYLLINVTGQEFPDVHPLVTSHFNPSSPIFEKRDYWFVVLSDIGILTQLFVLYNWYQQFGGFNVFINWFLPYVFTNHWLVFITFLQHTEFSLPKYMNNEWNFARGAAATIDREFGFVGWFFFHDIIETHVLHHYVSRIPFYNARIGTTAIKAVMGEHYAHSDENMWISLWNAARECQFVDGEGGLKMFRNINNIGVAPVDN
ncbi:unnamed protein product [Ambrosiozyma monospora]|uniref:Unnamed protein product n=1 Tax=Ambrosiozyma monospora TaxID=43982 RepID=A0A9W6YW81_AMBMO|nr:unnamed protein product [Ambrosiozyma monospora]